MGAGVELCEGLGTLGVERVDFLRNGSGLGSTYVRGGERPVCSTDTSSPTAGPTTEKVVVKKEDEHGGHEGMEMDDVSSGVGGGLFSELLGLGVVVVWATLVLDGVC